MSIDDGPSHEPEWSLGLLGRARAIVRRVLFAILGPRGENHFHGYYHRLLRATDRFGIPEDVVTMATLDAIARRSLTIIDVGANVGRYAWFLRRHAPAQARLFAVEPHRGAVELLRSAVDGLPGCTVLEVAASDVDGTAALIVPDGAFGSPLSGLAWVQPDAGADQRDHPIIRTRRIDGLIDDGSIAIRGPVFIKIDVEGGERRVLRGAVDLLRSRRPILYFECQATSLTRQGETAAGLWKDLRELGYQMYANRSGRFEPTTAVEESIVNYLAIPDEPTAQPIDTKRMDAILDAWVARTSST